MPAPKAIPNFDQWQPTAGVPKFDEWNGREQKPASASPSKPAPSPSDRLPKNLGHIDTPPLQASGFFSGNGFGPGTFGKGMGEVIQPGKHMAGLHDMATGAGEMALPLLPGAIWAKPAQTIAGLITGAGTGAAGKFGSAALGVDEDTSDVIGDATGLAGGLLGGKFVPSLFRADPRIGMTRGLRPPPSDFGFEDRIPETISLIKAANPGYKPGVENGKFNLVPAANKTINALQGQLEPWLQRAEGQTISGEPIIRATEEGINKLLPSEQTTARKPFTATGNSVLERAKQDYAEFTPQQLRDRLALLNERLSPFFNKNQAGQSTALADIPEAVLKMQRDAVADLLYQTLDPENAGAGPRQIQSRTGDVIHMRDAAARRNNAIVAEQPLTPFGKFADPLKGFIRTLMPGKATGAGIAFAEGSEGRSLPLVRRSFNAVPDVNGINELGSFPRPGPRMIGAPTDTSGPVGPAATAFRNTDFIDPRVRGLLGPNTAPNMGSGGRGGVNVPDIIGSSSRGEGTPQRLLAAPSEGSITRESIDLTDPRSREILAPSNRGWIPSAPGQPPTEAQIISKRGKAVPNTPKGIKIPLQDTGHKKIRVRNP